MWLRPVNGALVRHVSSEENGPLTFREVIFNRTFTVLVLWYKHDTQKESDDQEMTS